MPAPLYRPTSRALVIDAVDRLLLLRAEDPSLDVPVLWHTPGGGVAEGETYEQAALRELWEETAVVAPLGPCVWTRRHVFRYGEQRFDVDERYYVVRVESASVAFDNHEASERDTIVGYRWWSATELARTAQTFAPRQLVDLLPPVIAGDYPPEPVKLEGRGATSFGNRD